MTQKMQPVRGTKDLYGPEIDSFNYITSQAKEIGGLYGFRELSTPIFEFSEIFERNLGESSDIISKEVYKFPDRGDNFLTLRPEFTAGIVRSFISNSNLQQNLPQKFFSYGPIFRYDRPQKGRQRQFHQINFELLGAPNSSNDAEIISLAAQILKKLGILNKTTLEINSLGCEISRNNYQKALIEYFQKHQEQLSADSKIRLEKNPLRILDSKDRGDIEIVKNAPTINDFYEKEARENFDNLLNLLDQMNINYVINPRLVRGLDYYNSIVFEFISTEIGAQSTILAGGRYDNLIKKMGGPDVPAIGFAAGIERLMLITETPDFSKRPIVVIYVSDSEQMEALKLAHKLRTAGIYTEISHNANFKKQMKRASTLNAKQVIIIGEDEVKSGNYQVKDFDSGTQNKTAAENIIEYLK